MSPDPIEPLAQAIIANPRFKACALKYIDDELTWRKQLGIFKAVMNSYRHAFLIAYVSFLHFMSASGRPEDGATFGRIWEIVDQRKDCGKRSLRTFLGISTLFGFLVKERGSTDSRVYGYVPTAKIMNKFSEHLYVAFACIDNLQGGGTRAAGARANEFFFRDMIRKIGQPWLDCGVLIAEKDERLSRLLNLHGGFPILIALTRAEILGQKRPRPADLARLFFVSNSQARAVIDEIDAICPGGDSADEGGSRTAYDYFKVFVSRELAAYIKFYFQEEELFVTPSTLATVA